VESKELIELGIGYPLFY